MHLIPIGTGQSTWVIFLTGNTNSYGNCLSHQPKYLAFHTFFEGQSSYTDAVKRSSRVRSTDKIFSVSSVTLDAIYEAGCILSGSEMHCYIVLFLIFFLEFLFSPEAWGVFSCRFFCWKDCPQNCHATWQCLMYPLPKKRISHSRTSLTAMESLCVLLLSFKKEHNPEIIELIGPIAPGTTRPDVQSLP